MVLLLAYTEKSYVSPFGVTFPALQLGTPRFLPSLTLLVASQDQGLLWYLTVQLGTFAFMLFILLMGDVRVFHLVQIVVQF